MGGATHLPDHYLEVEVAFKRKVAEKISTLFRQINIDPHGVLKWDVLNLAALLLMIMPWWWCVYVHLSWRVKLRCKKKKSYSCPCSFLQLWKWTSHSSRSNKVGAVREEWGQGANILRPGGRVIPHTYSRRRAGGEKRERRETQCETERRMEMSEQKGRGGDKDKPDTEDGEKRQPDNGEL